eukprot:21466-Hanusia_phi.AAC.1
MTRTVSAETVESSLSQCAMTELGAASERPDLVEGPESRGYGSSHRRGTPRIAGAIAAPRLSCSC